MAATVYILNGPNLNLLGQREPEIYGRDTLADVEARCRRVAQRHDLELVFRQSNAEHELVEWIQEGRKSAGLIINGAGLSYHSVAILDALKTCECPVIEVHISNIHRREEAWRANSLLTAAADGMITGLGVHGYELALAHIVRLTEDK
jgi:3-dehydroquinate dehydratase-2